VAVTTTRDPSALAPAPPLTAAEPARRTELARAWRRFCRYRPGLVGAGFVVALVLIAVFAPVIAPYSPTEKVGRRGGAPSAEFRLGNDEIGRDVLSRLLYGSRVALVVGVGAMAIAVAIGVTIGAAAGYFGGKVDQALSRVVDTLMAFPLLALLITLAALFEPSLLNVVIVIGVTVWASYARVVRAEVLSLREEDFVTAARSAGATDRRIMFRHVLPNTAAPIIVQATFAVGLGILAESGLSFLGLGVNPTTPTWGLALNEGRDFIEQAWWISTFPGLAIVFTVLGLNLFGDGLRDALDVRSVGDA
jgi:peptide/nickel transport system permease protein